MNTEKKLFIADLKHNQAKRSLSSVTDTFSNTITIERDQAQVPTAIISPEGLKTELTIDDNNHLTRVTFPDGSHYDFEYSPDGVHGNIRPTQKAINFFIPFPTPASFKRFWMKGAGTGTYGQVLFKDHTKKSRVVPRIC